MTEFRIETEVQKVGLLLPAVQKVREAATADDTTTHLFFDEADALFGKRSEVNDAHDKYANQKVSHLIEETGLFAAVEHEVEYDVAAIF